MKTRPTVFISAVSHELGGMRRAVEGVIRRRGCFADCQDATFAPETTTVADMLRNRLREADAVIHIVGFRYGTEPADAAAQRPRRSYTQLEHDIALELKLPVYRFLTRSPEVRDAEAGALAPEPEVLQAAQLEHRRRIETGDSVFITIDDVADLCRHVGDIALLGARGPMVELSQMRLRGGGELLGRRHELALLDAAWQQCRADRRPRSHLFSISALGGEGKTALVAHWLAGMSAQGWPGCEAVFAWSFYSQGIRDDVSSELFLQEALRFFSSTPSTPHSTGPYEKGRLLAELIGERCALLLLDGIEPLQHGPSSPLAGELKDAGLAALLGGLAARSRGLCIVTTRYPVAELRRYEGQAVQALTLDALDAEGGASLLRHVGVRGPDAELQQVVRDLGGHALSLALFGSYLHDAFGGDVRQRHRVELPAADRLLRHGHAGRVVEAYLRWLGAGRPAPAWQRWLPRGWRRGAPPAGAPVALLNMLGLFDRAAEMPCLRALCEAPPIGGSTQGAAVPGTPAFGIAVQRLADARLIAIQREADGAPAALDAHPLVREYIAHRLLATEPRTARQGHHRLFDHFQQAQRAAPVEARAAPTLRDLEPLYRAIFHGCRAGLHRQVMKDVYFRQVLRWPESYPTRYLGAHGSDLSALSNFFAEPWSRTADGIRADEQRWLFGLAGARLRAVGRLKEAQTPLELGLRLHETLQDWPNAALAAGNLSELALVSGDLPQALARGAEAVATADRAHVAYLRIGLRTTLADACARAGRGAEAAACFAAAEALQVQHQPESPLLYGVPGARYCSFLLDQAAPCAWRVAHDIDAPPDGLSVATAARHVRHAMRRALQLHAWRRDDDPLLEGALLHLVMGRAALLHAWLGRQPVGRYRAQLEQAVSGLRRAGMLEFVPGGLAARACMQHWDGTPQGRAAAAADLDEAWEIAVRGPMPPEQVEILLARCRLFCRSGRYPWGSARDDIAQAEALCERHHLGHRMAQLGGLRHAAGSAGARGRNAEPVAPAGL